MNGPQNRNLIYDGILNITTCPRRAWAWHRARRRAIYHSTEIAAVVMPAPTEQRISLSPGWRLVFDLDQRQRDARAGGVADVLDVEEEPLEGHAAALGGGLEDAAVGLVGNDPAGFLGGPAGCGDRLADNVGETLGGEAEQGVAVDPNPRIECRRPLRISVARLLAAGHVQAARCRRRAIDLVDAVPSAPAETIAAPAPSPKRKYALRSDLSSSRDCMSTPTVSTLWAVPGSDHPLGHADTA